MKLIAHRGNINGPNPLRENSIDYIEEAISEGFDVEIDLRVEDNQCYLGHDDPQYFVKLIAIQLRVSL
jgi:glycerophosphoryl diester phosphodiesterase